MYRDLNDQWPMTALLEDIATLAARRGQPRDALQLLGAADALRSTIGSARPQRMRSGSTRASPRRWGRSATGGRQASREAGRRLSLGDVIELGLAACGAVT